MRELKRYIKITLILFKANVKIALAYRLNFISGVLSNCLWMALSLAGIYVITYNIPDLGGWNRNELIMVQGAYSVIFGVLYLLVFPNFKKIIQLVYLGRLETILIKPADSQFLVSVGDCNIYQVARISLGLLLVFFSAGLLRLHLNMFNILFFLGLIFLSIMVVYSIWFIAATFGIWLLNISNLQEILVNLTGITRYPLEIVGKLNRGLFYILLPLVVVTTVPSRFIIGRMDWGLALAAILIAGVLFYTSRRFWQYALKFYSGAG